MDQFDERDIIFSRLSLNKGSKRYQEYYANNPEKKKIDDKLRRIKRKNDDNINSLFARSTFKYLSKIREHISGEVSSKPIKTDTDKITKKIKGFAKHQGAVMVGVTELEKKYIYSHQGRSREHYGKEIKLDHQYIIVFAVEMNKKLVNQAPKVEQEIEVAKGYLNAGNIGNLLSHYIRNLGYEARNHMIGAYQVILPPLAEKAGLGEIGRSGLLVSKNFGPRVRLGAVSTNLKLKKDNIAEFGLKDFCNRCKKCAKLCPGKAISSSEKVKDWKIDAEKCYYIWQKFGTDCGVCLAVCPLSQEIDQTLIENMKDNKKKMDIILNEYKQKYGKRPVEGKPQWLRDE